MRHWIKSNIHDKSQKISQMPQSRLNVWANARQLKGDEWHKWVIIDAKKLFFSGSRSWFDDEPICCPKFVVSLLVLKMIAVPLNGIA